MDRSLEGRFLAANSRFVTTSAVVFRPRPMSNFRPCQRGGISWQSKTDDASQRPAAVPGLHLERQRQSFCALHALSAALGGPIFDQKRFQLIAWSTGNAQ